MFYQLGGRNRSASPLAPTNWGERPAQVAASELSRECPSWSNASAREALRDDRTGDKGSRERWRVMVPDARIATIQVIAPNV